MAAENKSTMSDQSVQVRKQKKGLSWWLSALTGKAVTEPLAGTTDRVKQGIPSVQKESVSSQSKTPETTLVGQAKSQSANADQSVEMEEDSVRQDIARLKKIVGKIGGGINQKVSPVIKKGGVDAGKKSAETVSKIVNTGAMKKIITTFFVIVLIMVLIFIGMNFFKKTPGEEITDELTSSESTPTSPPFVSYKPSVYADDLEIIKLDEEISTLESEFASSDIKETSLNIPNLDFDVSF